MFRDAMLHDSETSIRSRKARLNPDEPFFRALRKIRERYAGKSISTEELIEVSKRNCRAHFGTSIVTDSTGFSKVGSKARDSKTRSARHSPRRQVRHHHRHRHDHTKDAPTISSPRSVYATTAGNTLVFLGEVLPMPRDCLPPDRPAAVRKIVLDPKQTILTARSSPITQLQTPDT